MPAAAIPVPQPPALPTPPAVPKPAAPALTAPAPQTNWILLAIVGLVCFLAGGLLVFLLMKH
jgi:hypothetical protein